MIEEKQQRLLKNAQNIKCAGEKILVKYERAVEG
jgi:hypothetical protein